jgi:hypothetical protein
MSLLKRTYRGRTLSGMGKTTVSRTRPPVTITLSPEALGYLDAIARGRGLSRSATVEQLIRDARLALPPKTRGKR